MKKAAYYQTSLHGKWSSKLSKCKRKEKNLVLSISDWNFAELNEVNNVYFILLYFLIFSLQEK